jgi:predicted ribosomally synthesized peptide with SipW-like signal peptide
MKKILISLMTIAMVGALVGGGVFAYFSDVETSTGNTFTAGTLNLVPSTSGTGPVGKYTPTAGGDGVNGNVVFTTLAPGDSGTITWVLSNSGNLAGTLTIVSTVTFSDVDANEPETAVTTPHANNGGGNGDLDEFVGVRLQRGVGTDQINAESNFTYIYGITGYSPFSGLEAVLDAQSQAMAASGGNDTIVYKLSWSIASDIVGADGDGYFGTGDDVAADDNIIQSDNATADITFTLTQ